MKNRKLLLFCMCFFLAMISHAQQSTTDHLTIDGATTEMTVNGPAVRFYVKLNGSVIYSGYNMDIYLPEGLEFDFDAKGKPRVASVKTIWPYSEEDTGEEDDDGNPIVEKTYTHNFVTEAKSPRHVRLICYSSINESFTSTSGRLFSVYVKATSPYVNPNPKVTFKEIALTTAEEVEYDPVDCDVAGLKVSVERNVPLKVSSAARWSTCILPFDATIPEGVTAYTCDSHDDEYLYLTESESMEAFTPYILYSENGYSGTLSGTVDAAKYPENGYVKANYLNGAIIPQSVTSGYVMQNLIEGVKFYPIAENSTFTIPAGKCWVTMPEAGVKSLGFAIADETAITTAESKRMESEEIYTLQGVKVTKMLPGNIYIKGGKTVLKR